jgi:hypothetical protein
MRIGWHDLAICQHKAGLQQRAVRLHLYGGFANCVAYHYGF